MTTDDGFTRPLATIDADLKAQVEKRDAGTAELLHALFVIERSVLVIDRLIEERCRAAAQGQPREHVRSR